MILYRFAFRLLLAAGVLCLATVIAVNARATAPPASDAMSLRSVRVWTPPPGADDLASAQAMLQQAVPQTSPGARPEFSAAPRQPVWFALDLPANPQGPPLVLELTHPSIRAADLYLPQAGGDPITLRSGRDVPMQTRGRARFPATLELSPAEEARTVYLRLKGTVPLRGQFLLQARADWERQSRWQFGAMSACFSVTVLAVLYAFRCAPGAGAARPTACTPCWA